MASHSASLTAASPLPILLVCAPVVSNLEAELNQLLEMIRSVSDSTLQVMQVNEATHPEVVRSFNFTSLPAFALLQQGEELWQHTGPINTPGLFSHLHKQIQEALLKNLNSIAL
ncbi:thioredoxin family protein [Spirosoma pollinicola]|uniref:Thioredoxin n=1 Tax=Spirosoma pollinicola TaxID=2057025 RepID=A0A2K8YVD4_9BACT|nr:thioredoxin family protein [Spirosoma pollinicola]AUD01559.1 hypothetical protein CWM47_06855 [Spirosoma pollinicola]